MSTYPKGTSPAAIAAAVIGDRQPPNGADSGIGETVPVTVAGGEPGRKRGNSGPRRGHVIVSSEPVRPPREAVAWTPRSCHVRPGRDSGWRCPARPRAADRPV